jgi:hypothetical protein
MNSYPEFTGTVAEIIADLNLSFTVIFSLEVILKVIGLGIIGYLSDKMNVFDCVIVIIAMVELI